MPLLPQSQSHVSDFFSGRGLPHRSQNLPIISLFPQGKSQVSFSGFGLPHILQNLPIIPLFPQGQSHVSSDCGFLAPHILQKIPIIPLLPHGQSHVSACFGSGFLPPQSGQNLLWIFLQPQAGQSQPEGLSEVFSSGFIHVNIVPICGATAEAAAIPIPSPIISPTTLLPPEPPPILEPILPIPSA